MIVMGIDPGIYGALAIYDDGNWKTIPLPIVEVSKGRYELALHELTYTFMKIKANKKPDTIVIEQPPIVPGNGVLAYRSLFKGWGEIRGILTALDIALKDSSGFLEVGPKEWKKHVLSGTKKDKYAAIHYVQTCYPKVTLPPHPKPKCKNDLHDGIADAICIADYGRYLRGAFNAGSEDNKSDG